MPLVKMLEMEMLGFRVSAPPLMVVVVESTVVPLKVRVRSHANPFSPARETCLGDETLLGKNHWVMRLGRGTEAMVLRFSAVEGRRSEEIREGIVRELAVDGEFLGCGTSFVSGFSLGSSCRILGERGV